MSMKRYRGPRKRCDTCKRERACVELREGVAVCYGCYNAEVLKRD